MDKMEMLKKRFIAAFIDFVMIGALAVVLHVPLVFLGLPGIIKAFLSILIYLFFGFVLLAKDGPTWFIDFLRGQSPGKKAVGLIVVKLDGRTNISFGESITRNLPLAMPYFLGVFIQIANQFTSLVPVIGGFLLLFALFGTLACLVIMLLELLMIYRDPDMRRWGDHKAMTKVVPYD